MKTLLSVIAATLALSFQASFAANPSFSDFNPNQFASTGYKVSLTNNVRATNILLYGTPAYGGIISGLNQILIQNTAGQWGVFGNPGAAAFLTNDNTGALGWYPASSLGGASSTVTSFEVPMGAWYVSGITGDAFLSAATPLSVTNSGDAFAFSDTVTNAIRLRMGMPLDWNAGTVRLGLYALCTGTNNTTATNVVWSVKAAAVGDDDNNANLTFGTAVRVTNHVSITPHLQRQAVTGDITVGNTPTTAKNIIWQIERDGADSGDTLTNVNLCLIYTRIYFNQTFQSTFPTPSP